MLRKKSVNSHRWNR